jgi:hypothetical protein
MRARLLWLSFVVVFGCASGSSSPSTTTAKSRSGNNHDRALIEKAYRERNANALHELLDIVSHEEDRAVARGYIVKLRLDTLLALDCRAFAAAFEPVKGRPNPRTDFGPMTAELDAEQKAHVASKVLGAAARCGSSLLFSTKLRRVVPDADTTAWSDALIALERGGQPVYMAFLGTLKSATKGLELKSVTAWLVATRSAADCEELEQAARAADPAARAALVEFYTAKDCRTQLKQKPAVAGITR